MGNAHSLQWTPSLIASYAFHPPSGLNASYKQGSFEDKNLKIKFVISIEKGRHDVAILHSCPSQSTPRGVLVYFHGNAENLCQIRDTINYLALHLNMHVVVPDYYGYGLSSNQPMDESGLYEVADVALAKAEQIARMPDNTKMPIFVLGYSIGSCPAIELCSKANKSGSNLFRIAGLVVVSGIASGADAMMDLNNSWVPCMLKDMMRNVFANNLAKISQVQIPTLIIHGKRDTTVAPKNAHLLQNALQFQYQFKKTAMMLDYDHTDIFVLHEQQNFNLSNPSSNYEHLIDAMNKMFDEAGGHNKTS